MGSKKERNIVRFAVGTPQNPKSSIWRLWVQKDEVYLGAKDLLNAIKVSLHKSGIWRIAHVEKLTDNDSNKDRVVYKWNRPDDFREGWCISITIVVPYIDAIDPFDPQEIQDSRVKWYDPAQDGYQLNFQILFSKPGHSSDEEFEIIKNTGEVVVKKLTKDNGDTVWLTVREVHMPNEEIKGIKDQMSGMNINFTKKPEDFSKLSARMLWITYPIKSSSTSQPAIFNYPLGKENLRYPGLDNK